MPTTPTNSTPLQDADVRSLSKAYARVLESLAGRVRHLTELVEGRSPKTGDAPVSLLNPQGLVGCDMSGPPFGPTWRHPLVWAGGLKQDTSGAGQWQGHRHVRTVISARPDTIDLVFWVRPHQQGVNWSPPYSRGYVRFIAHSVSAASQVVVRLRNTPGTNQDSMLGEFSTSSTSDAEKDVIDDPYFNLTPGLNRKQIVLTCDTSSGVRITGFSVCNIAKREH